MNDQELRRARGFIVWGVFGLIILVAISIIASLLFFGPRSSGTFYPFFPALFFLYSKCICQGRNHKRAV
ncbi:MAG: hypothetical protein ACJ71O_00205 [Nitrososphaeraceae archaeon]